jgi:transcriptional regulator with GAF, ATPase, and Fis domain
MKIKTLQECQKAHLLMVLQKTAWDLDKTARLLQVPLARVKEKIRQYGLKNADQPSLTPEKEVPHESQDS